MTTQSKLPLSDTDDLPGCVGRPEELGLVLGSGSGRLDYYRNDHVGEATETALEAMTAAAKELDADGITRFSRQVARSTDSYVFVTVSGMAVKKPKTL